MTLRNCFLSLNFEFDTAERFFFTDTAARSNVRD